MVAAVAANSLRRRRHRKPKHSPSRQRSQRMSPTMLLRAETGSEGKAFHYDVCHGSRGPVHRGDISVGWTAAELRQQVATCGGTTTAYQQNSSGMSVQLRQLYVNTCTLELRVAVSPGGCGASVPRASAQVGRARRCVWKGFCRPAALAHRISGTHVATLLHHLPAVL